MKPETKVFLMIEKGKYEEITYAEFMERSKFEPELKKKKLFVMSSGLLEVSPDKYVLLSKEKRRYKYVNEEAALNGQVSLDSLGDDIRNPEPDVDEQVERKHLMRRLNSVLKELTDEEFNLVYSLFFLNMSERDYADKHGIYHNAVHKKKLRILAKLHKLLEK